ncbi:MAG: XRE family transcriptional regulator [Eubacteriales bacterium]|nr:XRE family transcriptional regulator [Eubacteriales bacterium]
MNVNKLKGKIVECGLTQEKVAEFIGIDRSTFCRKMKNKGLEFSVGEMHSICRILDLSSEDAIGIFLSDKSQ